MIKLYAFKWVPSFAQGFVRDLRVRWALEEAGIPYQVELVDFEQVKAPDYRESLQPFGQVPAIAEDGNTLFESGAILLHLAERSTALAPKDHHARARVTMWLVAALNSVEPFVAMVNDLESNAKEDWAKARRPQLVEKLGKRLNDLQTRMQNRPYLEGGFSVADILMTCVLREVPDDVLATYPKLAAYRQRNVERPAFKKALADQLAAFKMHEPKAAPV